MKLVTLALVLFVSVAGGRTLVAAPSSSDGGQRNTSEPQAAKGTHSASTSISDEMLQKIASLATDRARHPIKVADATNFLLQFGPVKREQNIPETFQFVTTGGTDLSAAIAYSKDANGEWTDPECTFYLTDPGRVDATFEVLSDLIRGKLGQPWRTKKEHKRVVALVWNLKKSIKVFLSKERTVGSDGIKSEHVELAVAKEKEEVRD